MGRRTHLNFFKHLNVVRDLCRVIPNRLLNFYLLAPQRGGIYMRNIFIAWDRFITKAAPKNYTRRVRNKSAQEKRGRERTLGANESSRWRQKERKNNVRLRKQFYPRKKVIFGFWYIGYDFDEMFCKFVLTTSG